MTLIRKSDTCIHCGMVKMVRSAHGYGGQPCVTIIEAPVLEVRRYDLCSVDAVWCPACGTLFHKDSTFLTA